MQLFVRGADGVVIVHPGSLRLGGGSGLGVPTKVSPGDFAVKRARWAQRVSQAGGAEGLSLDMFLAGKTRREPLNRAGTVTCRPPGHRRSEALTTQRPSRPRNAARRTRQNTRTG